MAKRTVATLPHQTERAFQEQVIKIARDFAGFTPGRGELLRRALGHKHAAEELQKFKDDFTSGAFAGGRSQAENIKAVITDILAGGNEHCLLPGQPEATWAARCDRNGGLLFSARFHVVAKQELKDAILVLDTGWAEGMAINTIEPSPIGQASRDGKLAFDLGHIAGGHSFVFFALFQVNATNVGRRSQDVRLDDGETRLLTIHRTVTVFP